MWTKYGNIFKEHHAQLPVVDIYNDFYKKNCLKDIFIPYNNNTNIQITFTIGWLNALELPKIHQLVKEELTYYTKIWNNLIHYPDFMSLKSAPEDLKLYISQEWGKYDWGDYNSEINAIENLLLCKYISLFLLSK